MRPDFHQYFMLLAKLASTRSTCNSRPNGAVIVKDCQVLATGYNGANAGMEHCLGKTMECPVCRGAKYNTWHEIDGIVTQSCGICHGTGQVPYCHRRAQNQPDHDKQLTCVSSHAEANAIAMAARKGIAVYGASIYCTMAPCFICAKLLHTAGIHHIYYELGYDCISVNGLYQEHEMTQIVIPEPITLAVLESLRGITAERRLAKTD
jgi:dCMP deaminase